jgi:small-conductance mechanosensitive channel/CRP-like cAMP-binding protein
MAGGVFVLLALLGALYKPNERRRLRSAVTLMVAWGISSGVWWAPFVSYGLRDTCQLVSTVLLALAATRSAWLLVVDRGLRGGSTLGISQLSSDLIQAALYIVVSIAAARGAGADARSLATTGGLVTAGLTFSLQATLGDLVAGLLLQGQAPFKVGDWIRYDDIPAHTGKVREINWRATTVVTLDQVEITVPNSVLAKALITNLNEPSPVMRRLVPFTVGYEHAPDAVIRMAIEALASADGVLASPPPICLVVELADAGIEYSLRFFIDDAARRDTIDSIARSRLWYAFRRAGIEFVFPRTDIAIVDDGASRAARDQGEHDRRREAFERVDFLGPLGVEGRERLARAARTQLYSPAETIVHEGERSTEFYIVAEGQLAVLTDRGRAEVARLSPGAFFGEMALLTGEPRAATVRALEHCVLCVVDKKTFETVVGGHTGLIEQISHILAERQGEIARKRGEIDATGAQQALRESTLLERMKRFFGG